jgi:hypothetical protein
VLRLNLDVTRTKKLKSKRLVMEHVIPWRPDYFLY